MSRFLVFTVLVSALAIFDSMGTLMAATTPDDSKVLIKCSTCGVEFTSSTETEQHMKGHPDHEIHAPAHPLIKCSTCGVDFTSHVSLKEHLQKNPDHQNGPLVKCSTCGVEFTSPGLYKEHLKEHSDG